MMWHSGEPSSLTGTLFEYPLLLQKIQERCAVCQQPIKGDSVESNSKVFHPECMRCYVCDVALRGTYFTYQDKPICEMHYKVIFAGTYNSNL